MVKDHKTGENQDDALANDDQKTRSLKPNNKGSSSSEGTQENILVVMLPGNTGLIEWG